MALKIQPMAGEQDPGSLTLVCSIQEAPYHKDRVVIGGPGEQVVELPPANTHSKLRVHQGLQSHKSSNRLIARKPRQRARNNPSAYNIVLLREVSRTQYKMLLREVARAGPKWLLPTQASKAQLRIGPKSASGEH